MAGSKRKGCSVFFFFWTAMRPISPARHRKITTILNTHEYIINLKPTELSEVFVTFFSFLFFCSALIINSVVWIVFKAH